MVSDQNSSGKPLVKTPHSKFMKCPSSVLQQTMLSQSDKAFMLISLFQLWLNAALEQRLLEEKGEVLESTDRVPTCQNHMSIANEQGQEVKESRSR